MKTETTAEFIARQTDSYLRFLALELQRDGLAPRLAEVERELARRVAKPAKSIASRIASRIVEAA